MEMAESEAPAWWEHSWEAGHRSTGCVCFIVLTQAATGRSLEQWCGHQQNHSLKIQLSRRLKEKRCY